MVMLTSHTGVDKINEDCLEFKSFLLNCFFHCIRTPAVSFIVLEQRIFAILQSQTGQSRCSINTQRQFVHYKVYFFSLGTKNVPWNLHYAGIEYSYVKLCIYYHVSATWVTQNCKVSELEEGDQNIGFLSIDITEKIFFFQSRNVFNDPLLSSRLI